MTSDSAIGAGVARMVVTTLPGLIDGWGQVMLINALDNTQCGLPLLVSQLSKATNPLVASGVSGTFGGLWKARVGQRSAYCPAR